MAARPHLAAAAVAFCCLPATATAASAAGFPNISDPVYPESLSCARFVKLGFDTAAFERYGEFFTEQSSLTLPAAGQYFGPDAIREYVMFASRHGLMFSKWYLLDQDIHFGGVKLTPAGYQCIFHIYRKQRFVFDPKYTTGGQGEAVLYIRVDYNPTWNKVSHIEVLIPDGMARVVFESSDTPAMRSRVCSDMQHACPSDVWAAQGLPGATECETGLAALPIFDSGSNFSFDGNSKACRYLHAAMAAFNNKHCYHISLVPMLDPSGQVKCQATGGLLADFNEGELAAWAQYAEGQGFEASVGYKLDTSTGLSYGERAGIVVGGVLGTTLLCAAAAYATCIQRQRQGGGGGAGDTDEGSATKATGDTEPSHADPAASAGHDVPRISSQVGSPKSSSYKDHTVARMNDVGILLAICAAWGCVVTELVVRYGIDPCYEEDQGAVSDLRSLLFKKEDASEQWDVTDTFFMSSDYMSKRAFLEYEAVLFCICIVFTGLGTEIIIGWYMCHEYDGDEETAAHFWKIAQFFFPFNMMIAVSASGHQNMIGIPFFVFGLWKFGFPETIGSMSCAIILFRGGQQSGSSRLRCLQHSLDALGTLVHHSCATLVITVLVVGLTPMTQAIGEPVSFLIVQHLVVLLKYRNWAVYITVELAVEAMFEWSVLSNFEHYYQPHGHPLWPFKDVDPLIRRAAGGMLLAHWIYLVGGTVGMAADAVGGGAKGEGADAEAAEAGDAEPEYVSTRAVTFRKMQRISFTHHATSRRLLPRSGTSVPILKYHPSRRATAEGEDQIMINTESSGRMRSPISVIRMHTDTKSMYVPTPMHEEQPRMPDVRGRPDTRGRTTESKLKRVTETSGGMQLERDVPIAVSFMVPNAGTTFAERERTQAQGQGVITGGGGAAMAAALPPDSTQPQPPPQPPPTPQTSLAGEMRELHALHVQGVLSGPEFEGAKQAAIARAGE